MGDARQNAWPICPTQVQGRIVQSKLSTQLLRFLSVGALGFVIDGGLLLTFMTSGVDPYLARLMSFPLAVMTTWWLNRNWTFSSAIKAKPRQELNRYLAVQLTGAACNYLAYAMVVQAYGDTRPIAFLGFVLGSFLGTFINFTGARHFAFRHEP